MKDKPRPMRDVFLERIWQAMATDARLFFTTADFGSPVLDKIRADFPERFINVGIAEQALINVSAGLAIEGFRVCAYAIAPFITMRCYEQIRVNLALLSEVRPMNVTLIGVGAGYSYVVSGPTHQCYEDISVMRALPNIRVLSPADHVCAEALFDACHDQQGIKYLRFDAQVLPILYTGGAPRIEQGFHIHRRAGAACLVATGYMLHTALKVAAALKEENIDLGVIDLFDLSRFDGEGFCSELAPYTGIITLEEGFRGRGGLDSLLFEFNARKGLGKPILNLGVEPRYRFELGSRDQLHEQVGIGLRGVVDRAREFIAGLT